MPRQKKHGNGSSGSAPALPPGVYSPSDLEAAATSQCDASTGHLSLSHRETDELEKCEATIALHRKAFIDVGTALRRIRDERLYRATHTTFEDYCRQRWEFSRPRAYQMIDAAEVASTLSTKVDTISERAVRPLTKLRTDDGSLDEEAIRKAWGLADRAARGGRVTAQMVDDAVMLTLGYECRVATPEECVEMDAMRAKEHILKWVGKYPTELQQDLVRLLQSIIERIQDESEVEK